MTEEEETTTTTFELADWEDLPLKVRRNRKHMYEYLKSVLSPSDNSDVK